EMFVPGLEKLEYAWLSMQTAQNIVQSFPNIVSLWLSLHEATPFVRLGERSWGRRVSLFDQIIFLLHQWAPRLKSLKLFHSLKSNYKQYKTELDRGQHRLISTIISLPELKHLTFETANSFYHYVDEEPLDLPILSRLNEFF